jgi:hypothetical protein
VRSDEARRFVIEAADQRGGRDVSSLPPIHNPSNDARQDRQRAEYADKQYKRSDVWHQCQHSNAGIEILQKSSEKRR